MNSLVIFIISVYAPCNCADTRKVWEDICSLRDSNHWGEWCVNGDFNAVIFREECKGRSNRFKVGDMQEFNQFIENMELIDVPPIGKKFTWFCSDDIAMSRLDKFLLSEGLVNCWHVQG